MGIEYTGYDLDDGTNGQFNFAIVDGTAMDLFDIQQGGDGNTANLVCAVDDLYQEMGDFDLQITVRQSVP